MKILRDIPLPTLGATEAEAQKIAPLLQPGDTLLLEGELGVGKTAFARALLRALSADAGLVVPSPTFNLVQVYDIPQGTLWHVDLYRLTSVADIPELGLEEAFHTVICLVEWPCRLGPFVPVEGLWLHFTMDAPTGQRQLKMRGSKKWEQLGITTVHEKKEGAFKTKKEKGHR